MPLPILTKKVESWFDEIKSWFEEDNIRIGIEKTVKKDKEYKRKIAEVQYTNGDTEQLEYDKMENHHGTLFLHEYEDYNDVNKRRFRFVSNVKTIIPLSNVNYFEKKFKVSRSFEYEERIEEQVSPCEAKKRDESDSEWEIIDDESREYIKKMYIDCS